MAVNLSILPFPPHQIRQKLSHDDWEACVQAWITLLTRFLYLSDSEFNKSLEEEPSLQEFILSYVQESQRASATSGTSDLNLRNLTFRLVHRALSSKSTPSELLTFTFLSSLGLLFGKSVLLKSCLENTWAIHKLDESLLLNEHRRQFQEIKTPKQDLLSKDGPQLRRITALLLSCAPYGKFLLSGSDFIDSLIRAWSAAAPETRGRISVVAFLALKSLTEGSSVNVSALLDHLYDLKARAEQDSHGVDFLFLRHVASSTPLVVILDRKIPSASAARAQPIVKYLSSIKDGQLVHSRRVKKGKRAEKAENSRDAAEEMHVHRLSSITQIQELFPDLGAGFVARVLDEYNDDVEQVTAHLLEGSLPSHLANADRSEPLGSSSAPVEPHFDLEPHSAPPLEPSRRNIHDEDEFDRLAISASQLHVGKKERRDSSAVDKAKIYSSLAAFDPDDDERDDTYDVQDVGGTIDVQGYDKDREDTRQQQEQHALTLFRAWKADQTLFNRDRATRQAAARQKLRDETGMTDEAIEGWALMLQRNPRRLRELEELLDEFDGDQMELKSSRWTAADEETSEGERSGGGGPGRGGNRGRGRGRAGRAGGGGGRGGRGRGGGNVAGPASDRDTQVARQRKDENKASRANHNRRAGRAKKLAKVGLPG